MTWLYNFFSFILNEVNNTGRFSNVKPTSYSFSKPHLVVTDSLYNTEDICTNSCTRDSRLFMYFSTRPHVSASCECSNKLPQTGWVKTAGSSSLTFQRPGLKSVSLSQSQGVSRAMLLLKTLGKDVLLASSSFCDITTISTSMGSLLSPLLCVYNLGPPG